MPLQVTDVAAFVAHRHPLLGQRPGPREVAAGQLRDRADEPARVRVEVEALAHPRRPGGVLHRLPAPPPSYADFDQAAEHVHGVLARARLDL